MAYGNYCPICGGIVDNNEFNFARDMCKECVVDEEQREIRAAEVNRLLNGESKQMELEDMLCKSN